MNGRIYDPKLGRFLQADSIVQAPKNSQNLNRYSYVLNNPLSYTDPSGYFIKELALFVAAVARVVSTEGADPSAWAKLIATGKNLFNEFGSQQGALPTGATAGAFTNGFSTATSFNTSGVQHGAVQETGSPADRVTLATIGGTGSDQTGWKFANGAAEVGFAYAVASSETAGAYKKARWHGAKGRTEKRGLTEGEIRLLRGFFGDSVSYGDVRIKLRGGKKWSARVIGSSVTIGDANQYVTDYSETNSSLLKSLLVHEVTHIWQNENLPGYTFIKAGLEHKRFDDPYAYTLSSSKSFASYRYEQQGQIMEDYALAIFSGELSYLQAPLKDYQNLIYGSIDK